MSKLLAVAALSGAGLMAGLGGATEAAAGQPVPGVIKGFATVYSSPSDQSERMYHLQPDTTVDTWCYREGQVLNGNPLWFIINVDGLSGYVHRDLIAVDRNVPHC
jgi:hypothetical protein